MSRLYLPALAIALSSATPLVAQQVCPTRADLAEGIVVTYRQGGEDTFTTDPLRPGIVIWQGAYQGMALGTSEFAQGYIFVSSTDLTGQTVTYDYGILPADLPPPQPGGEWEAVATVTSDGVASTERQIHRFGEAETLSVGACDWQVIPVSISYADYSEDLLWFAELGISVRAGEVVMAITPLALMP